MKVDIGEVGEHNGLIHRHFAGSSPATTTIFLEK